MSQEKPYRPNVGIALFNAGGKVLIGRRFRNDGPEIILPDLEWQMPQGGVDPGEDTWQAAKRELYEETSVRSVEKIGEIGDWLVYDIPRTIAGRALGARVASAVLRAGRWSQTYSLILR